MQIKTFSRSCAMLQGRKLFVVITLIFFTLLLIVVLRLDRLFAKTTFLTPLAQHDPVGELEGALRKKDIELVQSPLISDSAINVVLRGDNIQVLFSQSKDKTIQVSSLQVILNKLTVEGRKARKIDLRFDDPVVVY